MARQPKSFRQTTPKTVGNREYQGSKKTLYHLFKSPANWWEEAAKHLHFASEKDPDVFTAFFWETTLYNYLEHTVLAGRTADTVKKIISESALDFVSIKRKDDIWQEVYPQIAEQFELLNIRTREEDQYFGKEGKRDYGKTKEDTKTNPILSLASDKIKAVDWGEVSKTLIKGFYQDGKFNPNVENQDKSGWNVKTTDTKHQRQQQVGRIIQAVLAVDVDFTPLLEKYYDKYAWKWTSPPGEFNVDYSTGTLRFEMTEGEWEQDGGYDSKNGKSKPKTDPDLDEISFDQWQAKREKGEAVELDWDLECWARYKRRLESTIAGKSDAAQEVDRKRIKACERLMDVFSRNIYVPPLETHYDKVMDGITGFKFFKKELREQMELLEEDLKIGEKSPQVFNCLLGKPGVGKTEICKTSAKAMNRTICILSMGGATETKPLEGVEPAYKSSNWSDLLETFVEGKSQQTIFLKDIEVELKMYQDLKNKTDFQEQKIEELEKYIKDMKEKGVTELKLDLGCKAPIILLDEAEKVKDPSVLDAMGKILDDGVNWNHYDKFFEYRINLSNCLIFCTMNWIERAPDFIRDRCKFVDIELLSYAQRIRILENIATDWTRQFFPVIGSDGKVDRARQKQLKDDKELTFDQQRIRNYIGEKTIKACITQSWGIRGGMMNMKKVIAFLRLLNKRKTLWKISNLDDWNWDSDKQPKDGGDYSNKIRRLRYHDLPIEGVGEQKYEELIFTKKIDLDFEAKPDDRNWAKVLNPRNQIKDWQDGDGNPAYDPRTDDYYFPDGSRMFGEVGEPSSFVTPITSGSFDEEAKAWRKKSEALEAKITQLTKTYLEEISKKDNLRETERKELEKALNKIHSAGLDKERLLLAVEELEQKLNQMGIRHEKLRFEMPIEGLTLPIFIIKTVPNNGVYTFGKDALEKQSRLITFDDAEKPRIKKLIIDNCNKIIQFDLKGCNNLEKLSLRNSKWDSIANVKDCVKLNKVSVKDCEDVSLAFLEGTNVKEVKII